MSQVTDQDKFDCARRELNIRKRVYPHWVNNGRMKQASADREIEIMQAIADDYRSKIDEASLFTRSESA
jgi:hypothetical protein